MANRGRIQASSGSQFHLKGFCGACMRNRENPGFKCKGWSIRPLTRCRNSIFETGKSKAKPWQTVAGFKPQAEANSTSKGSVGHACETGKPQQDSSARGSIRPQTGCRNSIFETVKSKAKPWQTVAGFQPQAEANST